MFRFKCKCGREIVTTFGKTESCGCLQKEIAAQTAFRTRAKAAGEAQFNGLYCRILNRATRDGIEFRLSREEVKAITSKSCFYCGIAPAMIAKVGRNRKANGVYVHNGIDRVDSSGGYVAENVVPCCLACNLSKHTRSQQEFYDWVKRVHAHLSGHGLI